MQEGNTGAEGAEGDSLTSEKTTGHHDANKERNDGAQGAEGVSLTSEETTGHRDANRERNDAGVHRCNKFIIATLVIVITALFIAVISLAVTHRHCSNFASPNISSMDSWVTYKEKYFYISKEEKTWSMSLKACSLLNSSLAVIDTQKELDFWVHFLRPFHYWFGLSREANKVWKWSNGTEFRNQFPIHGKGLCAYVNGGGAFSAECSM